MHDLGLAAGHCDRVYVLDGGRVAAAGSPSDVLDAELVARVFGVRLRDWTDPETGCMHLSFERGLKLSGGERQRIAIARALLKDAPILVLDEPTSSVDAANEAEIQRALDELTRGRTTLVIAHRLSTVRDADRIVVLDRGRVLETGAHHNLLERHGAYAELVAAQAGGG